MKKIIFNKCTPLVFALLTINICFGQYSPQQIDSIMEYTMSKFNVAGCAISIVKDGKVAYSKGFGLKSIDTKSAVNKHTNFAIASNSKAFTTAALAILVEDKKLKWDGKVKDYIPEFKMYHPYVTENFNIQDLLSHRSGLGAGAGDLMLIPSDADFTIDDLLTSNQ